MLLQRWDPFHEMRRMYEAFDRQWGGHTLLADGPARTEWGIPLDVVEEGDELLVRASVPGVKPDDIDVSIEDGVLDIKAEMKAEEERKEGGYLMRERRTGSFRRALRLPDTVDADRAKTFYENGVLTIALPKAESKKAKHLKVIAGKALEGK